MVIIDFFSFKPKKTQFDGKKQERFAFKAIGFKAKPTKAAIYYVAKVPKGNERQISVWKSDSGHAMLLVIIFGPAI